MFSDAFCDQLATAAVAWPPKQCQQQSRALASALDACTRGLVRPMVHALARGGSDLAPSPVHVEAREAVTRTVLDATAKGHQALVDQCNRAIATSPARFWWGHRRPRPLTTDDWRVLLTLMAQRCDTGASLLSVRHQRWYQGSARQCLSGQLLAMLLDRRSEGRSGDEPLDTVAHDQQSAASVQHHPLVGMLLNPTGGLIGPGNEASWESGMWLYRKAGIDVALCVHTACHDASGFAWVAFGYGQGYAYRSECPEPVAPLRSATLRCLLRRVVSVQTHSGLWSFMVEGAVYWQQALQRARATATGAVVTT
jgi:hypothetical protein